MERYDTAVAGKPLDIIEHILARKPLGIVAGDQVPHDDGVLAGEPPIDAGPPPAVGGGGKMGGDKLVGLACVQGIAKRPVLKRAHVVGCVVGNLVGGGGGVVIEIVVKEHVFAHQ